jgi:aminomethyltransferase
MVSTFEQHLATRRTAGLFDFSFMSLIEIDGPGARSAVALLQTRSVSARTAGSIVYTLILNDDSSVFVDATLWKLADDRWRLFTGRRSDTATLRERVDRFGARTRDRSGEFAILALQGPATGRMLAKLVGEAIVRELRYFRFVEAPIAGTRAVVGRIGYSGELGYEILVPASDATSARTALIGLGAVECDFDAANSLRIESGYVLFDREITGRENPVELRLERLVDLDCRDFVGKRTFVALRRSSSARCLVGLDIIDRHASPLLPPAKLTSECDSPILRRRIGLGFAAFEWHDGTAVRLDDGRLATIARLPFYDAARLRPRSDPLAG